MYKKVIKYMNAVKSAAKRKWGLNMHIIIWIYNAVIEPTMFYACPVFCVALKFITKLGKWERAQRIFLNMMLRVKTSAPSYLVRNLADINPIKTQMKKLVILQLMSCCPYKLREVNAMVNENELHDLDRMIWNIIQDTEVDTTWFFTPTPYDFFREEPGNKLDISCNIRDREQALKEAIASSEQKGLNIYTDGDRHNSGTGGAFINMTDGLLQHAQHFTVIGKIAIFRAELLAILESMR